VIDEHTEEEAALYALGLLPPDEARRFEAALAADAELAALAARLETGAAAFAFTAPPRDPPPALRGRIIEEVLRVGPPNRVIPFPLRAPWLPWAIAACLAFVAGRFSFEQYRLHLLSDDFLLRDRAQQRELDRVQALDVSLQSRLDDALGRLAAYWKDKAALEAQLADLRSRDALSQIKIATLASMLKDTPQAMAVVAWDGGAQRGLLKTANLPAAGANQDYQLWIIDPDYKQPVSAGVFDPAAGARFQPLRPISKADKFAISLEKKGGAPAPQGPIVLVGS